MTFEEILHSIKYVIEILVVLFGIREIYNHVQKSKSHNHQNIQISFRIQIWATLIILGIFIIILQLVNPHVFKLIYGNIGIISKGVWLTVQVSLISIIFGSIIGVCLALLIAYPKQHYWQTIITDTSIMSIVYVLLGIPLLVLIYMVNYSGLHFLVYWTSIITLSINLSPFVCKIILASIKNISQDHIDSALMFGYSHWQITRFFKINFVIRNSLQPLLVEYYTTVKLSSLAGLIGLEEIYHASQDIIKETQDPITSYIILAICYVLIVTPFAVLADYLEHKWKDVKN